MVKFRKEKGKSVMETFRNGLYERRSMSYGVHGMLDKEMNHALHQWPKLVLFLGDPHIPLDNNAVENIIRPFVVDRKN